MKSSRTKGKAGMLVVTVLIVTMVTTCGTAETTLPGASRNLLLWDTRSALEDKFNPDDRSGWAAVPNDLLLLEKDPAKATSDPGYYGRDYSFKGDAVLETPTLIAAFWSVKGCVTLYSKQDLPGKGL